MLVNGYGTQTIASVWQQKLALTLITLAEVGVHREDIVIWAINMGHTTTSRVLLIFQMVNGFIPQMIASV